MVSLSPSVVVFIILVLLVLLLASVGNIVVIIVIVKFIKRKSLTNKFIINLAVADLFTGLAAGSQVLYMFIPALNTNLYTCLMRYQVVSYMTLTSQLTVAFITLDRYLAICHPHSYRTYMTPVRSSVLILVSWMFASVVFVLPFAGYNNWTPTTPCLFQLVIQPGQLLFMALTMWSFTIVTVAMYVMILKKACRLYHQVRPTVVVNLVGNGDVSQKSRTAKVKKMFHGAKALAAITLMFTVCWLPFTYFQVRAFSDPDYVTSKEWAIADWLIFLGMANSVMNPFIYAWQRKDFGEACKMMFRCKNSTPQHWTASYYNSNAGENI